MAHTLLLADDSVTIQRVIELTFADEDIRVVSVGDGQQAIDRITADPPDIVLADTGMPERDGYEVATFVKTDPALAHIPVVLLTGAFEPVDGDRARQAGCDAVLVKPFEPQVVIKRVRELLGQADTPVAAVDPEAPSSDYSLPAGFEARRRPVVTFDTLGTPGFTKPVEDTPAEPEPAQEPTPPAAGADDDPVAAYIDRVEAALDRLDNDDTPVAQPQDDTPAEVATAAPPEDPLELGSLEGALSALEGALDNLSLEPAPVVDEAPAEVVDEPAHLAAAPPEREPIPEPVVELAPDPVPELVVELAPDRVPEPVVELAMDPAPEPVVELSADPVPEPAVEPAPIPVVDSVPETAFEPAPSPSPEPAPDPTLRELERAFASESLPPADERPAEGFDPVPPAPIGLSTPAEPDPPIDSDVTVAEEEVDRAIELALEHLPMAPIPTPVEQTTAPVSDSGAEQPAPTEEPVGEVPPPEPEVLIPPTPVVDLALASAVADEPPPTEAPGDAVVEPRVSPVAAEGSDDGWWPPPPRSPEPPSAMAPPPAPPAEPPSLADAFASLLAAERGEATRARTPYPWPSSSTPVSREADLVDRVTERVLARLSASVSTELVSQIVTRVAERLVQAELDRRK